jgi:hypothetical protein
MGVFKEKSNVAMRIYNAQRCKQWREQRTLRYISNVIADKQIPDEDKVKRIEKLLNPGW